MATKVGSLVVDMRANTSHFSRGVGRARKEANGLKKTLGGLRTGLLALGGAFAFKQLVNQINTYSQLSNQLKLVTKDAKDLAQVQKVLFDAAQETRGGLEGTVKLYSRLARSTKSLNLNQGELVNLTKLINKTLVISGASTQEASAAILQLGQGFASGVLRGQELNSVMEQTPRLSRAMADGLGVGIGQLREMGKAGKLTSEVVVKALQTQANVIDTEFNKTAKTIAQAMTQIENEFLKTFGSAEGGGLVESLDSFRKIISDPNVSKGLTAIATGIVSVGAAAAGALGYLAQFGTFIGQVLAGGQLKTLDQRIAISERRLARATRELGRNDRFFRTEGTKEEAKEDFQKELKELEFLHLLKKGQDDAATSAEELKNKLLERKTVFEGAAFGSEDTRDNLKILADRLNEERRLEQENADAIITLRTQAANELLARAEKDANKQKRIIQQSTSAAISIFRSASQLYKGEGKKRNEESKTLAKVAIGISTAVAIMNAAETKPFFPVGLLMTIKAGLLGASQLQAIGAGGGSSVGGGVSAVSSIPAASESELSVSGGTQSAQSATQIIFTGDMLGEDLSERLIEIIKSATNDRDIVIFNGDSRQAQEIREAT